MSVNVKQNGSLTKVGGLYHDSTLGQELDEFDVSTADVLDADYILTKSGSTWYRKALSKVRDYIDKVLAPIENGTKASRAYAKGEHFILWGYFCTARTNIAEGATLTENTNYKKEILSDYLTVKATDATMASGVTWITFNTNGSRCYRSGNHVSCQLYVNVNTAQTITSDTTIITLPYTMYGRPKFAQINKFSGNQYPLMTDISVYISANSKNVQTRGDWTTGNYYISFNYLTTDPI